MLILTLMLATLLMVVMQMLTYRRFGLRSLHYTARFDTRRVSEGDRFHFVEIIWNTAFIPMPWVRVESAFDLSLRFHGDADRRIRLGTQYHQFHYSVFTLPARTKVTREHEVVAERRGVYHLDGAAMTTGDLFGLHTNTKHVASSGQLIVYPRIVDLRDLPVPVHRWLGELRIRRSTVDDPFLTSGVREYVQGDPMRLINWKATARTGDLMVHRRDYTADAQIVIYLNVEDSFHMWNKVSQPEVIERAIVYAASAANYAITNGARVGLVTNAAGLTGPRLPIASGASHLESILESLARLQLERQLDFTNLLEEDVRSRVTNQNLLVLTTYVDGEMEEMLLRLQQHGNTVTIVNPTQLVDGLEARAAATAGPEGGERTVKRERTV
jgi:uncharacterized protein (DUF58 family)